MSTSHDLARLLSLGRLTHVVDIGANPIDGAPPYRPLLDARLCRITGFEPQASALAELNLKKGANEAYLPYAVGDGQEHTLNLCAYPGWTSIFVPSVAALEVFSFFKNNARVVSQIPIQTRRLDDLDEVDDVDFLKIDVQGGELAVFVHGREKLKNAVAVQTELQFVNLYEGQPSFGQVDQELRAQGFIPHAFAALKKWPIAPLQFVADPTKPLNQSAAQGRFGLRPRLYSRRRHVQRSAQASVSDRAFVLRQLRSGRPLRRFAGATQGAACRSPPGIYRDPAAQWVSAQV
jgi:FkbM family methyltransferase